MKNSKLAYTKKLRKFWTKKHRAGRIPKSQPNKVVEGNLFEDCLNEVKESLQQEIEKRQQLEIRRHLVESKGKWIDSVYHKLNNGDKITPEEEKKIKRHRVID